MDALASESISILLIVQSSSEYSITLCVRKTDEKKARKALEEEFHFEQLHGLIEEIGVQSDRAVVSLVGEGMKHYRGIAARFLTAVSAAGVNVEVIAQGSTECAIALVVNGDDAKPATRATHTAFFSHSAHIDVVLLGCGNVGGELLDQFQRQAEKLVEHHVDLRVRAIANSEKLLVADDKLDLSNWREALDTQGRSWALEEVIAIRQNLGLLSPTIVDCTTDEELAGQYVKFLNSGFNIVAANKKANTADYGYYGEMCEAAARNFRKFLYETNVAAGLPLIDTLQNLIRSGDELVTFEGILSGSLSMIFGLLQDGEALSKPGTHEAALAQLVRMQGREVVFHTAVAVIGPDGRQQVDDVPTAVRFRRLPVEQLDAYLQAEKPYDCAGAAKIEALGITLLESVRSDDPTALIGLPLIRLTSMLAACGVRLPAP
jgi:aspartokinase/homoserine dehydrogenase 1